MKMTTQEEAEEKISQFDYALASELSSLLGIDAMAFMKEKEEEEHRDRAKMKKGFNSRMRSEANRLRTFVTYKTYSSWTPQDMAAAGFYFTGVKSGVQCFCCSLILFGTSTRRVPVESHKEFRPGCGFLLGRDVGNIGKYDVRVRTPEKEPSGVRARYGQEEARLESFRDWPFYVQAVSPKVLAAAGFIFTGKRDTVQCFSCGGCLGNWEEGDDPWQEHAKWFPKCEFLQSKKSSEEIAQYIQSYQGFVEVTGEHFVNSWVKRELPMASAYDNDSVFANEDLRQDTFRNWPREASAVAALVKAGLFYRGVEDQVQCFSCGGCMKNWQEGDDPLADHTKYFPSCPFLQNMKSSAEVIPDLQDCGKLPEIMETTSESKLEEPTAVSSLTPDAAPGEAPWCREAKSLSELLRSAYTSARFRHLSLLESPSGLPSDHLLGCDLALTAKRASSPVQEPLTLPEVLANLNSVMSVEGEAGSGKTVLLKKIAFLWASGCCPLLHRFQLVFYLSLSSISPDEGLAHIICDQLLAAGGTVSEMSLRSMTRQLGNRVLFLLDDYRARGSVPRVMETLIHRSHLSRTCRLIAVRTNRGRDIRRHVDTVLEIGVFPFYNTFSILRRLFPHDQPRLRKLLVHFGKNPQLQGIHKTPLFVAATCAYWFQYPSAQSFDHLAVFKAYMECLFLKHKTSAELFRGTVASCGELALKGFFSSRFEFSGDELAEAGVDEDEDLTMCLMSRFTAQRLRPVYQFLSPAFQEFLAGKRLSELLDSDKQEDQDLGLYYLKQINSPLLAGSSYRNFLKHVSSYSSTKVGPKVVSHLLHLADSRESLENPPGSGGCPQREEEMPPYAQAFRLLWQMWPEHCFPLLAEHLLDFSLRVAYESNTVATCAPFISKFLQGRSLPWGLLSSQYFFDHPESLQVLRSVTVSLTGSNPSPRLLHSEILGGCFDRSQTPTVDQDYASAFESLNEWEQDMVEKEENIKRYHKLQAQRTPDLSRGYWQLRPPPHKLPLLQVRVTHQSAAGPELLAALAAVFAASQRIELHVEESAGFLESVRPALQPSRAAVAKCALRGVPLSAAEQELLLALPALEALDVSGAGQVPDQIFPNLDKFPCLRELSVNLDSGPDVFSLLPEEFPNLHHMEKLLIQILDGCDASKLVKLIQNSPDLRVFRLNCCAFSDFESLMTALASCKKLNEITFCGPFFDAIPFVTILPSFTFLKILNLKDQQFPKETAEKFDLLSHLQQCDCAASFRRRRQKQPDVGAGAALCGLSALRPAALSGQGLLTAPAPWAEAVRSAWRDFRTVLALSPRRAGSQRPLRTWWTSPHSAVRVHCPASPPPAPWAVSRTWRSWCFRLGTRFIKWQSGSSNSASGFCASACCPSYRF
ncbi:PREDICTED: baculoviral IAP repeat-containing protein 1 isoform X2 [Chinchilla lanigera]|uniref:baculoviral IAP repeat-containing protein 1 isoform X2 n=1 Tax=Chinchilla lanigera TaxID=34839 RepID=UPI000696DACA|nr:PREDICTED: baculoviral IAP repeat-containing protein 1 isoform X2 [Chinchilla lanigera]XP_013365034.1 PREDICTED: baculoviral IAP repeat-containing protein 1 isoform X2 [Chinchilla lanigera]XP_013365035.1 PREDICTED: baculoviral IAP repeat-containing protein 1 isoform X2 [Chinchilla lanigera]